MQAAAMGSMPRAPHHAVTPSMENVLCCLFNATTAEDEIAAEVWTLSASGGIAPQASACERRRHHVAVTGARAVQRQSMR
jgi:hypothetical protein